MRLTPRDEARAARAAALLGPANPVRHGNVIWLYVSRVGGGAGPELMDRLLRRLHYDRIDGELELVDVTDGAAKAPERQKLPSFGEQWDSLLTEQPADWSDLWAEVELTSSDYLEPGALLLAPVNPARAGTRLAYRFRVARRFGYGASAEMTHRCLERLDEQGITGEVRIPRALSTRSRSPRRGRSVPATWSSWQSRTSGVVGDSSAYLQRLTVGTVGKSFVRAGDIVSGPALDRGLRAWTSTRPPPASRSPTRRA